MLNQLTRPQVGNSLLWLLTATLLILFQPQTSISRKPHKEATAYPKPPEKRINLVVASWYGNPYHGRKTASGEIFDKETMTYASRTDYFGKHIRLTVNGKSIEVRCNDRGPFINSRDIDISEAAARKLGMIETGIAILEKQEIN